VEEEWGGAVQAQDTREPPPPMNGNVGRSSRRFYRGDDQVDSEGWGIRHEGFLRRARDSARFSASRRRRQRPEARGLSQTNDSVSFVSAD